jgi:hypothetical protein
MGCGVSSSARRSIPRSVLALFHSGPEARASCKYLPADFAMVEKALAGKLSMDCAVRGEHISILLVLCSKGVVTLRPRLYLRPSIKSTTVFSGCFDVNIPSLPAPIVGAHHGPPTIYPSP